MVARATIVVKDANASWCRGRSARGGVSGKRASHPRTAGRHQGGVKELNATSDLVSLSVGEPTDEEDAYREAATIVFCECEPQRVGAGW
jgi:hypothetical protein